MYPNERYALNHMRTLLISRFMYNGVEDIARVQGCKVVILVQPDYYDFAACTLFLSTGIWPVSRRFTRRVRGMREGFAVVAVSSQLCGSDFLRCGYKFLWKCHSLYFPALDGTDPRAESLFNMNAMISLTESVYRMPFWVEAVPELDVLTGKSFNIVKAMSSSWNIRFTFITGPNKTGYLVEHLNAIRALGLPVAY